MDDIEKAFSGKFKEQRNSESVWTPVPDEQVPKPRWGTDAPAFLPISTATSRPRGLTSAVYPQARLLRRRRLRRRLQVLHRLPRRDADLHQDLPAHGRVGAVGGGPALLHPHHQQVGPGSTGQLQGQLQGQIQGQFQPGGQLQRSQKSILASCRAQDLNLLLWRNERLMIGLHDPDRSRDPDRPSDQNPASDLRAFVHRQRMEPRESY